MIQLTKSNKKYNNDYNLNLKIKNYAEFNSPFMVMLIYTAQKQHQKKT